MADNNTLVAASELPITESEEVNVMCIEPETGEMKLKTGVNLGDDSVDGVIDSDVIPCYTSTNNITVTKFDFETIKAKILAGKIPNVLLHCSFTYGNEYEVYARSSSALYNSSSDIITLSWYTTYQQGSDSSSIFACGVVVSIKSDNSVIHARYRTID